MWISTLGLDLLWLSDRKGGHQAEKDKAELPFKFDMNSGCALKEKKKEKGSQQVTSCRHPRGAGSVIQDY